MRIRKWAEEMQTGHVDFFPWYRWELHRGTLPVTKSLPVKSLVSPLRLTQVDEGLTTKAMPTTSSIGYLDVVSTKELLYEGRGSPHCHLCLYDCKFAYRVDI